MPKILRLPTMAKSFLSQSFSPSFGSPTPIYDLLSPASALPLPPQRSTETNAIDLPQDGFQTSVSLLRVISSRFVPKLTRLLLHRSCTFTFLGALPRFRVSRGSNFLPILTRTSHSRQCVLHVSLGLLLAGVRPYPAGCHLFHRDYLSSFDSLYLYERRTKFSELHAALHHPCFGYGCSRS